VEALWNVNLGNVMVKTRMDIGLYGIGVADRHLARAAANADRLLAC
jgi:hypothetical protein